MIHDLFEVLGIFAAVINSLGFSAESSIDKIRVWARLERGLGRGYNGKHLNHHRECKQDKAAAADGCFAVQALRIERNLSDKTRVEGEIAE